MSRLLGFMLLLSALPCRADSSSGSPAVDLVVEMYRSYAWEAVIHEPQLGGGLFFEPRETLERFLVPELAERVLADRAHSEATGEIGALDFAPLWDSQDPAASQLAIRPGAAADTVTVEFVHPGHSERTTLTYRLVQTPEGWRIADIEYAEGRSLRAVLTPD